MTATILAILTSQAAVLEALIKTQTPAVQLVMWERYLTLTAPLHALLEKLNGVSAADIAATQAATDAALAVPVAAAPAVASGPMPTSAK